MLLQQPIHNFEQTFIQPFITYNRPKELYTL